MIVTCIGGPHDSRQMDVPDDGVTLEFLDGATYKIELGIATYVS